MSDPKDHIRCARLAFDEAEQLHRSVKYRWAAVAYFYAAMHMIHSALPTMVNVLPNQQHPEAHGGPDGTNAVVRTRLPHLDTAYRSLYTVSIGVRYYGQDVKREQIDRHRHEDLPPIASWVCFHLHGDDCGCWLRTL